MNALANKDRRRLFTVLAGVLTAVLIVSTAAAARIGAQDNGTGIIQPPQILGDDVRGSLSA